jgi:hypothetical protein
VESPRGDIRKSWTKEISKSNDKNKGDTVLWRLLQELQARRVIGGNASENASYLAPLALSYNFWR